MGFLTVNFLITGTPSGSSCIAVEIKVTLRSVLPGDHPKYTSLPPLPESGELEPEDDLTPDEEDPSLTHVDSDAEEGDEVEIGRAHV